MSNQRVILILDYLKTFRACIICWLLHNVMVNIRHVKDPWLKTRRKDGEGSGSAKSNIRIGWLMWICCDDATQIVCFLSFWFLFLLLHTCLLLNANISQQCLSDLLASRVWNLCWKTTCVCNAGFALITRAFWQDGNIIQSVICL